MLYHQPRESCLHSPVWGWGAGEDPILSIVEWSAYEASRTSTRRLTSALAGVHAYEATPDVTALQSCRTVSAFPGPT